MPNKTAAPITVAVTPEVRQFFAETEIRGKGGFQALCRSIATRLQGQPIVRFEPEEFKRVVRYSTHYGAGGFQQRLRLIVSLWVGQHMDELVKE